MKKYVVMLSVALLPLFALTSCNDDDDDKEPEVTLADNVEGIYSIQLMITPKDAPLSLSNEGGEEPKPITTQVVLTEKSATTVDIDFASFENEGLLLNAKKLENVTLTGELGAVGVSYTGTVDIDVDAPLEPGDPETPGENPFDDAPITLSAAVKESSTLEMTIVVKIGEMEYNVAVTGNKNAPL